MEFLHKLAAISGSAAFRDGGMAALTLFSALAGGLALHAFLFAILRRIAGRTPSRWDDHAVQYLAGPSRILLPLLLLKAFAPALKLRPSNVELIGHFLSLAFLATVSFLFVRLIYLLRDFLLSRYDLQAADNLAARKVHTQIKVLEKALLSIVAVATVSFMLMTFEGIRQVGISILASAGIAGVIIGLAAQKSIGTLLAGIQIAVTQPIRMDDVVIVEGEWGRIEEITLTYVVVRIWDLRRLIVPITHFIEKPFQNWTRNSSEILGTVFLYVDYGIPVELVRHELLQVVKSLPLWDGKVCGLQVTDCKEDVLELRMLVSAASAGDAWDLRCQIREKMISFIQVNYPGFLPRMRTELSIGSSASPDDLGWNRKEAGTRG